MTMLFLNLHHYGIVINEVFWGLWLLPFGLLVYKSGFLPRIIGAWLVLNCFAYLAQVVAGILFPLQFGELAIMLWLLIVGAKRPNLALVRDDRPSQDAVGGAEERLLAGPSNEQR
jgi:Domain of unknown function (DUF4386)